MDCNCSLLCPRNSSAVNALDGLSISSSPCPHLSWPQELNPYLLHCSADFLLSWATQETQRKVIGKETEKERYLHCTATVPLWFISYCFHPYGSSNICRWTLIFYVTKPFWAFISFFDFENNSLFRLMLTLTFLTVWSVHIFHLNMLNLDSFE